MKLIFSRLIMAAIFSSFFGYLFGLYFSPVSLDLIKAKSDLESIKEKAGQDFFDKYGYTNDDLDYLNGNRSVFSSILVSLLSMRRDSHSEIFNFEKKMKDGAEPVSNIVNIINPEFPLHQYYAYTEHLGDCRLAVRGRSRKESLIKGFINPMKGPYYILSSDFSGWDSMYDPGFILKPGEKVNEEKIKVSLTYVGLLGYEGGGGFTHTASALRVDQYLKCMHGVKIKEFDQNNREQ